MTWRECLSSESIESFNPNNADLEDLIQLPGVGTELAERIIESRPFNSAEAMQRVPGIGAKMLEGLSGRMTELKSEMFKVEMKDVLNQFRGMRTRVEEISLQLEELACQTQNQATFIGRLQRLLAELFGGLVEESVE